MQDGLEEVKDCIMIMQEICRESAMRVEITEVKRYLDFRPASLPGF